MKIAYTKHALEKFKFLESIGWKFTKNDLKEALEKPDSSGIDKERGAEFVLKEIDERHNLRVIQEKQWYINNNYFLSNEKKEIHIMKKHIVIYEPEDDVLNIWLGKKPIDYAEDENGVIVHYNKDDEPVYIEILDATKFLNRSKLPSPSRASASISHRIR